MLDQNFRRSTFLIDSGRGPSLRYPSISATEFSSDSEVGRIDYSLGRTIRRHRPNHPGPDVDAVHRLHFPDVWHSDTQEGW